MNGKKAAGVGYNGAGPVREFAFERVSGTWPFVVYYE
jgi:hypothetical protein